jgi:hypothetical protein
MIKRHQYLIALFTIVLDLWVIDRAFFMLDRPSDAWVLAGFFTLVGSALANSFVWPLLIRKIKSQYKSQRRIDEAQHSA